MIASSLLTLGCLILLLFGSAGRWTWASGWIFFGAVVVSGIAASVYLHHVHPDLLAARINRHEGTKPWHRWVLGLLVPLMIAIIDIPALDDGRFRWSDAPVWDCSLVDNQA